MNKTSFAGRFAAAVGLFLCLTAAFSFARGELSANLKLRTVLNEKNGKPARVTYVNADGEAVVAEDKGYATVTYTYDPKGRVSREAYLDEKGRAVNSLQGFAVRESTYISSGQLKERWYYGADGAPATGPEGYHHLVNNYDLKRLLTSTPYDTQGRQTGLLRVCEYDKLNHMTSDSWYDPEGHLRTGPDGYARMLQEYQSKTKTLERYLDENGMPFVYQKKGFATFRRETKGGTITESWLDGSNRLMNGPKGYARVTYTVNQKQETTLEMYYNADGSPYFFKDGYCGIMKKTGLRGRVTEESYYVGEGKRGYCSKGYSKVIRNYTASGKIATERYYDEKDRPMTVEALGYAGVKNTYGSEKRLEVSVFQDVNQKPVMNAEGYAGIRYSYDGKQVKKTVFLDTDGETPINCTDGYSTTVYLRDANGRITSERWYDKDGKAVVVKQNADEIRTVWNGSVMAAESYWACGKPVNGENGYHRIEKTWADAKHQTSESWFDEEGNPVPFKDLYVRIEWEYDENGHKIAERYYDAEGNPTACKGGYKELRWVWPK